MPTAADGHVIAPQSDDSPAEDEKGIVDRLASVGADLAKKNAEADAADMSFRGMHAVPAPLPVIALPTASPRAASKGIAPPPTPSPSPPLGRQSSLSSALSSPVRPKSPVEAIAAPVAVLHRNKGIHSFL